MTFMDNDIRYMNQMLLVHSWTFDLSFDAASGRVDDWGAELTGKKATKVSTIPRHTL